MSDTITVSVQVGGQTASSASFDMNGSDVAPPPEIGAEMGQSADDAGSEAPPPVLGQGNVASSGTGDGAMAPPPEMDGATADSSGSASGAGDEDGPPPPDV